MAASLLVERTYSVLYDYFTNCTGNCKNFWQEQMRLGMKSEIYTSHDLRTSTNENRMFVLMIDCLDEIRAASAKQSGAGDIYKVISTTFKENSKKGREHLSFGYKHDGKCYITNSYYVLCTNKEIDVPEPTGSFPTGIVGIVNSRIDENKTLVSDVPTLSELKTYIKLKKAEQGKNADIEYVLNDGNIFVKAEYLKRIIEFLDDYNIMCYTIWEPEKRPITPLLFTNNAGEIAVLCTIKKF